MKKFFGYISLLLITLIGFSQSGYEIIQNERTIDRPLNLHAGQFRLIGDYTVGIVTAEYLGTEKVKLVDLGRATSSNDFDFGFRYGITEFIEAEFQWGYFSQIIRGPEQIIFSEVDYKIARIQQLSGGIDPYLGLSYRVQPIANKTENKTDLILHGGITLPFANSGPQDPEYSIETVVDPSFDINGFYEQLIYLDHIANGSGTLNVQYGASFKHRFENVALTGIWKYTLPLGTSTHTFYDPELLGDTFDYDFYDYDYQSRDRTQLLLTAEYQFFPVFNVAAGFQRVSNTNGWSEISGRRLRLEDQNLLSLLTSYEIIVTSRLWISQYVSLPVSGENDFAPIFINTSLRYNFFLR